MLSTWPDLKGKKNILLGKKKQTVKAHVAVPLHLCTSECARV